MQIFNRFLPILSTILVVITFELWVIRPIWTFYMVVVMFIIIVGTIWSLTGAKFFKKTFWNFLPTPLSFLTSAFIFFLLIDNLVIQQVFIFGIAIIYALMLHNIFSFLYQTKTYQPYALENIYSYVNMTSLFLFFASFYGLILFIRWPVWLLIALMFLLTAFLFMRTLWSHKIEWRRSRLFILLLGIMIAEVAYAISFLPTGYLFNALLLILIYYFLMNIVKDHLVNLLNGKRIKRYLLITISIAVIAILTTRWY